MKSPLNLIACLGFLISQSTVAAAKPNIVVIVADDLGYADVAFNPLHPKEITTPHLDALAKQSIICRQGYVTGYVCSPTRAGLMTGRYQQRLGLYTGGEAGSGLPKSEQIFPQFLKPAGYVTGQFGKWHLGPDPEWSPALRGFDEVFGFLGRGAHDYFKLNDPADPIYRGTEVVQETGYLTDRLGEETAAFITRNKSKPFFAYLAFNAVHAPLQAPADEIAKFNTGDKDRDALLAMGKRMDDAIGNVVATLKKEGVWENTLLFFFSDNGGPLAQTANNTPLRAGKHSYYEGGIRVPFLVCWPSQLKPSESQAVVSSLDVLPTALAAAGLPAPEGKRLDGINLLPLLRGETTAPQRDLFWCSGSEEGWWAIRHGDWKLVGEKAKVGLFDLSKDISEKNDLAKTMPEKVAELRKLHEVWLEQMANPSKGGTKKRTAEQSEPVDRKAKKAEEKAKKKEEKRAQNKAERTEVAVPAAPQKRPNVLFVISDDLSSRIGPTGDKAVLTPVLDRLASEAMTFPRAYCQYPVCGPSRASFLSGLYPQSTGILDNETNIADIRPGTPSIPGVFRQAGYWTAAVGKVFHKPLENPSNDAWDQVLAFENDETAIELAAREKFEKEHGPITGKNRKIWRDQLLTVAPQTRNQGVKGVGPGYGPTGLRDDQHADGKNARQVAEWITTKASAGKPFMIACGFHKPHIPFIAPDAYFAKYPIDSIKLSRSPANDWDDIPRIASTQQYKEYGFPDLGKEDDVRRREFMQAYYACISFIDAQLGLIIEALHKSGEWENTIIVFVGDHGYHLGEHFMWGKVHLFEESARMPFMVRVPGVTQGAKNKGLVEMVDIFPTLAELCNVAPPAHLQGRSLVPMLKDPTAPGKEYAYTVVKRRDGLSLAVRFGNWRYTEWGSPDQAELYDLDADPQEFTNLVGKKESVDVLTRAKQVLAKAEAHAKSQFIAPPKPESLKANPERP